MKKYITKKNIILVTAVFLILVSGLLIINKPSYAALPLENTCPETISLLAMNEETYLEGENNRITLPYGRNFMIYEDNRPRNSLSPKNYRFFVMKGYDLFTKEVDSDGISDYYYLNGNYADKTPVESYLISYLINDTKFSDDENEDDYYQQLLVLWAMDRLANFEDDKNYIWGEDSNDYGIIEIPIENNYYDKYNEHNYSSYVSYSWKYENNLSAGDKKLLKESKYGDKFIEYLNTWEDYVDWYLSGANVELDSITQDDIAYYATNDYIETKPITPKSTGKVYSDKFTSYTVTVSSPMTVLDAEGNEKTTFNAGESFKVRIPIEDIKDKTLNYSIRIKGNFAFDVLNLFNFRLERYEEPSIGRQYLYEMYQNAIAIRPCSSTERLTDNINLQFQQKVGDLNIRVIDTATGLNLTNATVQIEDEKSNVVYRYETTEKDFNVTLPVGNYIVKQTVTPPNYEAITVQMRVSVDSNGESEVVLENAPLVNVPDTNKNATIFIVIGSLIIVAGVLILINSYKLQKKK